jgi:hypothetical protein
MTARIDATSTVTVDDAPPDTSRLYQEGIVAGILGAATIALWFLVVDAINGRPLWTPTVLGTVLFRGGAGLTAPESVAVSAEMVLMFTWVHGLVFVALGGLVAHLLAHVERHPGSGFGVLLLFVVFEAGFTVTAMVFAAPVLHALTWPSVLVANILAAVVMGAYFRLRHPTMSVNP